MFSHASAVVFVGQNEVFLQQRILLYPCSNRDTSAHAGVERMDRRIHDEVDENLTQGARITLDFQISINIDTKHMAEAF